MTKTVSTDVPTLSVLIATYNRLPFLARAVRSVLDQTYGNYEVLIVDDASSPPVGDVADPRFRVIRHYRNQGCSSARSTGLAAARSKWVVLLDDDDSFRPGALHTIAEQLETGEWDSYPMIQFRRSGATLDGDRCLVRPEDYFTGRITGEYCQVFQKSVFLERYDMGVGNAHDSVFLWRIARDFAIPSFGAIVQDIHTDAPNRFTGWRSSLRRVEQMSSGLSQILDEFGEPMRSSAPGYYRNIVLRAVLYHVLAGHRPLARGIAQEARLSSKWSIIAWAMARAPEAVLLALHIGRKLQWRLISDRRVLIRG